MGLISGAFGNASRAEVAEIQKEFAPLMAEGETIRRVYKYIRDYFVFTSVRLVMVEKKDIWGKKVEYHSIPYARMFHFSIETAGHADTDHKFSIWVAGMPEPITKKVSRSLDIFELQVALASILM